MSDVVKVKYEVIDEFSKSVDSMKKKSDDFDKTIAQSSATVAKWGASLTAVGVAGVFALNKLVEANNAQLVAEKQLSLALEQIGQNTAKANEAVLNQAGAMQKIALIGDEKLLPFYSRLIFSIGDTNTVLQLFPKIVDFASASGKGLEFAVNAVSMALAGTSRSLKQFGIEIDTTVEKQEILNQLGIAFEKFAGSATIQADTLTGILKNMGLAIGDMIEPLGAIVETRLKPFALAMLDLVYYIQAFVRQNARFIADLGILATVTSLVAGSFLTAVSAIGGFKLLLPVVTSGVAGLLTALKFLLGFVLGAKGLVAGFVFAFGILTVLPENLYQSFLDWTMKLQTVIPILFQKFVNALPIMFEKAVQFIGIAWQGLIRLFEGSAYLIGNIMRGIGQTIIESFVLTFANMLDTIQSTINKMIDMANIARKTINPWAVDYKYLNTDFLLWAKNISKVRENVNLSGVMGDLFGSFSDTLKNAGIDFAGANANNSGMTADSKSKGGLPPGVQREVFEFRGAKQSKSYILESGYGIPEEIYNDIMGSTKSGASYGRYEQSGTSQTLGLNPGQAFGGNVNITIQGGVIDNKNTIEQLAKAIKDYGYMGDIR